MSNDKKLRLLENFVNTHDIKQLRRSSRNTTHRLAECHACAEQDVCTLCVGEPISGITSDSVICNLCEDCSAGLDEISDAEVLLIILGG